MVLRGPIRGRPLSADGLDEILDGVRKRTELPRLTRHQPLEAVQAQAGHRSIESTRIYIHLANSWLETSAVFGAIWAVA
ncbi:hypothetical protein AB0L04_33525 [Streptomyces glaucescens]|uniref:hypothetical protein n=1 Tax=Streptomyces glaucescens TaxID=1907 RepID=UPI00344D129D